jgi:geranylgeranyl diphosphate synthase type II
VFNSFAIGICEGQQLDMDFENQKGVSLEEYTKMIEQKTAILLKGALQIGAIMGDANPKDVELIGRFGLNLGLAFQLQDDLLDVYGDPSIFGKKEGGDIVANKKTVLTIMAFNKANRKNLEALNRLYGSSNIEPSLKIKEVVRIFNEENIKEDVELLIASYFDKALDSLEMISVTSVRKEILKSLANKIMVRNN